MLFNKQEFKKSLINGFVKRKKYWLGLAASTIVLSATSVVAFSELSKTYSLAVNHTPSIPYEVFLLSSKIQKKDFNHDAVFEFKSPVSHYDTIKKGDSLTKRIGCMPGEYLSVVDLDYYCGENFMGMALTLDSNKRPMNRQFIYEGIIPENKYFVLGDHTNSFDSRYYGFIAGDDFTGVAIWKK